jgi:hypothetical protein
MILPEGNAYTEELLDQYGLDQEFEPTGGLDQEFEPTEEDGSTMHSFTGTETLVAGLPPEMTTIDNTVGLGAVPLAIGAVNPNPLISIPSNVVGAAGVGWSAGRTIDNMTGNALSGGLSDAVDRLDDLTGGAIHRYVGGVVDGKN